MNQTAKTFLALGFALLIWAGGVGISQYVQNEPERKLIAEGKLPKDHAHGNMKEQKNAQSEFSEFITKLEAEVEANPENLEKKLELGNAYFQAGVGMGEADFLKRSAGIYNEIVEKDGTKGDALLGLATLSLHVGVFDKASEYYEKYVKLMPDDLSARANLALAKGRGGDVEAGLKIVDEVLVKDAKFVIALVTKGIILKESGKMDEAKKLFDKAISLEENPSLKERIIALNKTEEKKEVVSDGATPLENVEVYFMNHEILRNKFDSLKVEGDKVVVVLANFPVDAMPPFAKSKLEGSLKTLIQVNGYNKIILVSKEEGRELISVGAN
jgi:tetratricopeptide (TPR) repeat protein